MRQRTALAGAALLAVTLVAHGSARAPAETSPLDASAFRPVVIRDEMDSTPRSTPTLTPEPAPERTPTPTPFPTRPPVDQPEVTARPELKQTLAPARRSARGVPTYYCRAGVSRCTRGYPDVAGAQMYAAAGPSLRVGDWRGRVVTVTAPSGRSVRVKLIDWCACGGSHFIDLYYDAFKLLGFPSQATVTW